MYGQLAGIWKEMHVAYLEVLSWRSLGTVTKQQPAAYEACEVDVSGLFFFKRLKRYDDVNPVVKELCLTIHKARKIRLQSVSTS
jgi:hypothetical protein